MKSFFDTLNLTSTERRIVVGVLVVVFLFLNYMLVWPHFNDWSVLQTEIARANKTLRDYENAVTEKPALETKLGGLEREGMELPSADQSAHFRNEINRQVMASGVNITRFLEVNASLGPRDESQFFEEKGASVNISSRNEQLVDFLYSLGSTNSMIRVLGMNLSRGTAQTNLSADLKLVGSYQKDPAEIAAATRKKR